MNEDTLQKFRDLPPVHRFLVRAFIIGAFPFFMVGMAAYEFCCGIRRALRDAWLEVRISCAEVRDFWRETRG